MKRQDELRETIRRRLNHVEKTLMLVRDTFCELESLLDKTEPLPDPLEEHLRWLRSATHKTTLGLSQRSLEAIIAVVAELNRLRGKVNPTEEIDEKV